MAAAVGLVMEAEAEYDLLRPGLPLGQCVDVWMLGVHPNYRRRNIAQLLTDTAVKHAQQSGFKFVILESTGSYSAMCAEKAGMTAVVRKVSAPCYLQLMLPDLTSYLCYAGVRIDRRSTERHAAGAPRPHPVGDRGLVTPRRMADH